MSEEHLFIKWLISFNKQNRMIKGVMAYSGILLSEYKIIINVRRESNAKVHFETQITRGSMDSLVPVHNVNVRIVASS